MKITAKLKKKLKKIKLLIIDNDGVMAKPFVVLSNDDHGLKRVFETKLFCIHDGSSCWGAKVAGLELVLVSGRASEAVYRRAKRIKIDHVYLDRLNKVEVMVEVMEKFGVTKDEIAYIGDDFLDIPILKEAGIAFTVNDAVPEVKDICDYITDKNGGEGAVAEVIRVILNAQGKWKAAVEKLLGQTYGASYKGSIGSSAYKDEV